MFISIFYIRCIPSDDEANILWLLETGKQFGRKENGSGSKWKFASDIEIDVLQCLCK